MKPCSVTAGVVCLLVCPLLFGQRCDTSHSLVSLYQLEHKPNKQARQLFQKASDELKRADYTAGLKYLNQALAADPDFWAAENDVGYAYLKLSENAKAEEAFERAIDIDPENPSGYTNLGVSALLLKDYKLAEKSALRALRYGEQNDEAKALLGLSQVAEGHYTPEAHRMLDEASATVPAAAKLARDWSMAEQSRAHLIIINSTLP